MNTPPMLLFICTGNIYRSRFAEALFNFTALRKKMPWYAVSRGVNPDLVDVDISPHTLKELKKRNIPLNLTSTTREKISQEDIKRADRIIVLDKEEHLPYLEKQFPDQLELFEFWSVKDLDQWKPVDTLTKIEELVSELVEDLCSTRRPTAPLEPSSL